MEPTAPTGLSEAEREALAEQLASAELRPSILNPPASSTQDAYRRRFNHYAEWARAQGYQFGPDTVTTAKVDEYIRDQVRVGALRPSTLRVAVAALAFYAERAGIEVPDMRQAKQMVQALFDRYEREEIPKAYTVVGKGPRAARSTRVRPDTGMH